MSDETTTCAQQHAEQLHAEALARLRRAKAFLLVEHNEGDTATAIGGLARAGTPEALMDFMLTAAAMARRSYFDFAAQYGIPTEQAESELRREFATSDEEAARGRAARLTPPPSTRILSTS